MKLHYAVSGRGTLPLILVHELGGSLASWDGVVSRLDEEFRVLRYDARGAGRSEPAREPFTMEDQAADLFTLVGETSLHPPFLIAGAAGGSAIAVTFAARHPGLVRGLILCPPALSVTPDRRRYLAERAERASREGMAAIVDQTLDASYPPSVIRDLVSYRAYRERFLQNDPVSYALANGALAASTADRLASAVSCPCLLLAGAHDSLRPLDHVRTVARDFPHGVVDQLDSAHIMSQQAPEALADRIIQFRDEILLRGRSPKHG